MLAIALVQDGVDRKTAAENCGMDRQTLRDWAHRYNAEGVSGLFEPSPAGSTLSAEAAQKEDFGGNGSGGSRPRNRWGCALRRIDLKRKIEERFGVTMHERTVGKQLASPFGVCAARPQHPKSARMPGGF